MAQAGLARIFGGYAVGRMQIPPRWVNDAYQEVRKADANGVWVGRVLGTVTGNFFPRDWSRDDVLRAIGEAYQNYGGKRFSGPLPGYVRGRAASGLLIYLLLDDAAQVLDAIPVHKSGAKCAGAWFCPCCGRRKMERYLCPVRHDSDVPAWVWWLLSRWRMVFGRKASYKTKSLA